MFWAAAFILLALLGLILLSRGIRGRRIDDHPICRKCRFDLVGSYPSVERCPECGADLSKQGAVRLGNRSPRRAAAVLGAAFLGLAVLSAGTASWSLTSGFNWNTVKPAWLLVREVRAQSCAAAREELLKRGNEDRLTTGMRQALVEHALDVHGDRDAAWDSAWAGFLEDEWSAGTLTHAQLARYARQTIRTSASVRPQARQGAVTGAIIDVEVERVIRGANILYYRAALADGSVAGEPLQDRSRGYSTSLLRERSRLGLGQPLPISETLLGPQSVTASVRLSIHIDDPAATPLVEWTEAHDLELEVVPADTQLVELVTDPELDAAVREAITITSAIIHLHTRSRPTEGGRIPGTTQVRINLEIASPMPISLHMDAVAIISGRTITLGRISRGPLHAPSHMTQPLVAVIHDFDGDTLDIILRPSIQSAEIRGVSRIWGGEIIFRDVKLTPPE